MEASSPRSGTDRTDRSNYTSSATSGCGTSPSCSASASGGSIKRSAAQTDANSAAGSPGSTAKSYPTPEESSKAYTDYSGTDRSATDRSHSEPYSRSERMSGHSGSQSSEQDAAYSDYSDQYSYSESSGPPSARPAANLAEGVRSFLGPPPQPRSQHAQRTWPAPAEVLCRSRAPTPRDLQTPPQAPWTRHSLSLRNATNWLRPSSPRGRRGGMGRRAGFGAASGGEEETAGRWRRRGGDGCCGWRRRGCEEPSRRTSTLSR